MTTRVLLLPAVIAGLFAATWSPARGDLPQAPAPRPKKTTAELLVGTWQMVSEGGTHLPAIGVEILMEFTGDGKFDFRVTDPKYGLQRKTGTYTVLGNTVRQTCDPDADDPAGRTWDVTIISITDTELIEEAGPARSRERSVSKRVEKK